MRLFKQLCLLLMALCLLTGCAPACSQGNSPASEEKKPVLKVDMLQSDVVPDTMLHNLQESVWPKNDERVVITDKAAYDALLAQPSTPERFLSYDDLQFLGDFVSFSLADGDPNTDGLICPNYAYTFHDPLLELNWTLYVIEGRPEMPNETYQPTQDLFYEFRDLYKDSYVEDMRTQAIAEGDNVVEVRHGDALYFYKNQNGKGACKAVLFENDYRAFLAVGEFSAADFAMDPQFFSFLHRLLTKSRASEVVDEFLAE